MFTDSTKSLTRICPKRYNHDSFVFVTYLFVKFESQKAFNLTLLAYIFCFLLSVLILDTLVDIFGKLTLLVWIFLFYFRINWVIVFPDMDVYSLTFVSRLVGKLSIFSVKYTPICYENHFGQACWSKVGKMKILAMESCVYARKVKKLLPDFEFFVWIRQLK